MTSLSSLVTPTKMMTTKLSDFPINDVEELAAGKLYRMMTELCMAWCMDCKRNVTEWLSYDDALSEFINHRMEVHHAPRN